ncbi:hypothetical protein D3C84_1180990 [compost metagenome]
MQRRQRPCRRLMRRIEIDDVRNRQREYDRGLPCKSDGRVIGHSLFHKAVQAEGRGKRE